MKEETCDKCEKMYPTLIHTCVECDKELGRSRGYEGTRLEKNICWECYYSLKDAAWKYEDLCK